MFLLATTEPSTGQIGLWVMIAFSVMSGLSTLVTLVSVFATKREMDALAKQIETHAETHKDIFSKLGGIERGLRGEFRDEMQNLREEIQTASASVAAMTKAAELLNQQLIEARTRIDSIKDRR